jgi:preprotein translocase subunit Sec63
MVTNTHASLEWRSRLKDGFAFGSAKVFEACTVLGLSRSASKDQVQAAFRNLARVTHPDVSGDPAKFRAVVEARDVMLKHLGTTEFRT